MSLKSIDELPMVTFADLSETGESPYSYVSRYRDMAPLARMPFGVIGWRHRHIERAMSEHTRQMETELKMMQGITSGPIYTFNERAMLFLNGDAHMRRRQPISRTFAFKLMDAMRGESARLTRELVAAHKGKGPFDFVSEIAAQIPARIIASILGVPQADLPIFLRWVDDTAAALGFIDAARRETIEASMTAFDAYVAGLVEERRRAPKEDFLTAFTKAIGEDEALDDIDLRTQVMGLILAGSDTTRNSLCMTLTALWEHPEQWRALCADPDGLKKAAVDEGLRYEPVISGLPRFVTKDLEVDGWLIPAGTLFSASLIGALRDPDVYADPDSFNIFRTDHPRWHPVFGAGAHRCAGEALARAELEETIAVIAREAPNARLAGPRPRLQPGAIRKVDQMVVDLG
ncbi:MAG: cytochrome P450 [Alphaproteobacteria bacterium]|nr:cytochrome P450 [Alphaproteobacteria bacterium]